MKDSKLLTQIRIVCRILIHRLDEEEEPDVMKICREYLSPGYDDSFYLLALSQKSEISLTFFYSLLICLALASNFLAIGFAFKRKSKSYHNSMVISLTVSSLMLVMFCIPFNLSLILNPFWNSDNIQCKLASYLQNVAVISAMLTPVFIAVERYLAIFYPLQFKTKTNSGANCFMLIFIWSSAIAASAPNVYWFREISLHNLDKRTPFDSNIRKFNNDTEHINMDLKGFQWKTVSYSKTPRSLSRTFTKKWQISVESTEATTRLSKRKTTTFTLNSFVTRLSTLITAPPSSTTKRRQEAELHVSTRSICVHDVEHEKHILIYRSCLTALFVLCFLIILFIYSIISYRLFKRSFKVDIRPRKESSHSSPGHKTTICYHIPSDHHVHLEQPYSATFLPGYKIKKNDENTITADVSVQTSESLMMDSKQVQKRKSQKSPNSADTETSFSETSTNLTNYWIAWRSAVLFGIISFSYLVTWCPINAFELFLSISRPPQMDVMLAARRFIFQFLACISSCLNPFFYVILHDINRIHLRKYCKEKINAWECIGKCPTVGSNRVKPLEDDNQFQDF